MDLEELKNRLALHMLPGIGPVLARALISYCGSIDKIFSSRKGQLERIPGIGKERAAIISKGNLFKKAEEEIAYMNKNGIRPLFYLDEDYPRRLKNCVDAPLMLFFKGNASLNTNRIVSIVGTRFMTPYGKSETEKLIEQLAKYKVTIVSGLAYGIDVQAHRSALKHGLETIGVIAHGLDRMYPSENKPTADKMIQQGGLLTEYIHKTNPDRENFPARNRIVAGMCDAVIVMESAEKGGALITAELGNDYNREVFALPGRTSDHFSKGCHKLIRENKAMLFESAENIATMMSWEDETHPIKKKKPIQQELFATFGEDEMKVIEILKQSGNMGIDTLAAYVHFPVNKVSGILLNLEFAGVLRSLPGKRYELI